MNSPDALSSKDRDGLPRYSVSGMDRYDPNGAWCYADDVDKAIASLRAERDEWKRGAEVVNGRLLAEIERLKAELDQIETRTVDGMNELVLTRAALAEIRDQGCGCDDRDEHWTCPACIARDALDGAASVAPAVRDPEAVNVPRCPRCGRLPRPTLTGGLICAPCGGLPVLVPVDPNAVAPFLDAMREVVQELEAEEKAKRFGSETVAPEDALEPLRPRPNPKRREDITELAPRAVFETPAAPERKDET